MRMYKILVILMPNVVSKFYIYVIIVYLIAKLELFCYIFLRYVSDYIYSRGRILYGGFI